MAKRRMGIIAVMLCFCLCLMPCTALAASTNEAKEAIITDRECSLTVSYRYDGNAFSDQSVKLYMIAEASENALYTLVPSFAESGLILNGVQTTGEWNVIRSTLESYILANNVAPMQMDMTDETGEVCFVGLRPGLYLTSCVCATQGGVTCSFDSALVALPGLDANGYWQYQISVAAKPEYIPPSEPDEDIPYKVLKLWKGDKDFRDRPVNIEVEIFRDGILVETIILSEEKHWSYSWSAKEDGAKWNVVERNIPEGYAMTIEERSTTFVLTNSFRPDDPEPPPVVLPQTGDTSNILLYAVLMFVSGVTLVLLGITGKRHRHEETE